MVVWRSWARNAVGIIAIGTVSAALSKAALKKRGIIIFMYASWSKCGANVANPMNRIETIVPIPKPAKPQTDRLAHIMPLEVTGPLNYADYGQRRGDVKKRKGCIGARSQLR